MEEFQILLSPRCALASHFSVMFSDRGYYVFHADSGNIDPPSLTFLFYAVFTRGLKKQRDTNKLSSQWCCQKVNNFDIFGLFSNGT